MNEDDILGTIKDQQAAAKAVCKFLVEVVSMAFYVEGLTVLAYPNETPCIFTLEFRYKTDKYYMDITVTEGQVTKIIPHGGLFTPKYKGGVRTVAKEIAADLKKGDKGFTAKAVSPKVVEYFQHMALLEELEFELRQLSEILYFSEDDDNEQ